MSNNTITIEKGRYTALLRRILGMQLSENGVPEMEAILNTIHSIAESVHTAYRYGATKEEIEDNLESIQFALEYYHLRKEDLHGPTIEEHQVKPEINLKKSYHEDTFG